MTVENIQDHAKVFTVGAGLGGLVTSILPERAGIPFDVYEQDLKIKPIEDAYKISKSCQGMGIHDGNFSRMGGINLPDYHERPG
ncbi:hypothetical protein BGX26_001960 [Mortierella sp. AD094]|nr:hypothetical protein BGX26_001960 [Mortierella sp. AD094]